MTDSSLGSKMPELAANLAQLKECLGKLHPEGGSKRVADYGFVWYRGYPFPSARAHYYGGPQ